MGYEEQPWVDAPATTTPISAARLTHIEDGLDAAADVADSKYTKPGGGIPKTDLAADVQTSLGKADTSVQSVSKASIGLGNVDNTSDAAKPVSTAAQAALDLKAPLASPAFVGTPTGITKAHVGLSSVDNTSDVNKPISTATQAALDALAVGLSGNAPVRPAQGVVCFTFDDAYIEDFTVVKPILTAQGIKAGFPMPTGYPGSNGTVMSWAQVKQLQDDGHEIIAHSVDHAHLTDTSRALVSLTPLTDAQLRTQVNTKATFASHDITVKGFAYPFGEHDIKTRRVVRDYFDYGLGILTGGVSSSQAPLSTYAIKRFVISDATVTSDHTAAIDSAKANGEMLVFIIHSGSGTFTTGGGGIARLNAVIDYAQAQSVPIRTPSAALAMVHNTVDYGDYPSGSNYLVVDSAGKTYAGGLTKLDDSTSAIGTLPSAYPAGITIQTVVATANPVTPRPDNGPGVLVTTILVPGVQSGASTNMNRQDFWGTNDNGHFTRNAGVNNASWQPWSSQTGPTVANFTTGTTFVPGNTNYHDFQLNINALASDATFSAPVAGLPVDGQMITLRIKDNGISRALAFSPVYRFATLSTGAPSRTVPGQVMFLDFKYNSTDSKWDFVGGNAAGVSVMVDVRNYITTGNTVDFAAVVAAMEAGGGYCYIPHGDWVMYAPNIGLNNPSPALSGTTQTRFQYKFVGAGRQSRLFAPAGMTPDDYFFKANSANTNTLLDHPTVIFEDFAVTGGNPLVAGYGMGGFFLANQRSFVAKRMKLQNLTTGFQHTGYTDLVRLEQMAFDFMASSRATTAMPWATGTNYAIGTIVSNGGKYYHCVTAGTSAASGGGPTGTGYTINDNGVIWCYFDSWCFKTNSNGDGVHLDQCYFYSAAGINMTGNLGVSVQSCIGGWHRFTSCDVTLDECHFEHDGNTISTPGVVFRNCIAHIRSGVYQTKSWRPTFSIEDQPGGSTSKINFDEDVRFLQRIDDPGTQWAPNTDYSSTGGLISTGDVVFNNGKFFKCLAAGRSASSGGGPSGTAYNGIIDGTVEWGSAYGPVRGVDIDILSLNKQSEITLHGLRAWVLPQSSSINGGGGASQKTLLGPTVTASGTGAGGLNDMTALQTVLSATPVRIGTDCTIRYTSAWEVAPAQPNSYTVPTRSIAKMFLAATSFSQTNQFFVSNDTNGAYFYKAWVVDAAGRATVISDEVTATLITGNIIGLTFNTNDSGPVAVRIVKGTTSGTYTKYAQVIVGSSTPVLHDQGTHIGGTAWSAYSGTPALPTANATRRGQYDLQTGLSVTYASAVPGTGAGSWALGDQCWNTDLSVGPTGWICTTAGSPGTWTPLNSVNSVFSVKDYGAVGNGTANDTTAIQSLLTAVGNGGGGTVFLPKGTYKITTQLYVPLGVSLKGSGALASVIKTSAAITMLRVGSSPTEGALVTPSAWTEGTLADFSLDGTGVAVEGLHVAPFTASHRFESLLVQNINGPGYLLDATQNCLFTQCDAHFCDTALKIINGSATNNFLRCEYAGSISHGIVMDVVDGFLGHTITVLGVPIYQLGGARDNTFTSCIVEQGTPTEYVLLNDAQDNHFQGCIFAALGNANAQYVVKSASGGQVNSFDDCQFSADNTITYLVLNDGFQNSFRSCTFNAGNKAQPWISTSQYILIERPTGAIKVTNTAGSGPDQVQIVPWPHQQYGDSASRPDFGTFFSPTFYYDTDLKRAIWWNGSAWQDDAGPQLPGYRSTQTSATPVVLTANDVGYQFFTNTLATGQTITLPSTGVPAGRTFRIFNLTAGGTLTVNSSSGALVASVAGFNVLTVIANQATPTLQAHWNTNWSFTTTASGNATGTTIASRGVEGNLKANAMIPSLASVNTNTASLPMTVASFEIQQLTGNTSGMVVTLPTTSITAGQRYTFINSSNQSVTINSSLGNLVKTLTAGSTTVVTALIATPTTAANWYAT